MSSVDIPDDLIARLRALEGNEEAALTDIVSRALASYVNMAEAKALVARAREREAALARAGLSEQEIAQHFEQWRRRHGPCR